MADAIPFRPFSRHQPCTVYYSHRIPHWRQDGCTYFVTFRLADSLPQEALNRIEQERNDWLRRHGGDLEKLNDAQKQEYLRLYSTALESSLDHGHGRSLLKSPEVREIASKALAHFDQNRARIGDFVIMPNHVHVLLTPLEGEPLEELLKSIKGFTARGINRETGNTGKVWQRDNYDQIVRDGDQLRRFQHYIANNPFKANLRPNEFTHQTAAYGF